jgi:hypothetical protein
VKTNSDSLAAARRDFCESSELWDYAAQADAPGIGLYGEYYNFPIPANPQDPTVIPDFNTATLVFKRIDPVIDTDLTNGSPGIGVQSEWFLVRWEGKIKAEFAEQYTFYVDHDNGARLWVNGVQLVNNWTHTVAVDSGQINLAAETFVDIKLEFFEGWGTSHIKLEWESASQPRQVVPTERLFPKAHLKTRYEAHAKFTETTGLDAALAKVLINTNSFVQDDGDKLKFYAFEQLEVSFAFDESNIKEGTFKFSQRDLRSALTPLRNSWQADFRDLETQYLEKAEPPVVVELDELQDAVGRVVSGEVIALENMTRYQAEKVLRFLVKRETEMNIFCSFDALASAFAVLPGDLVTVTHSLAGWTNKTFIVIEATDKSSEETADERSFVLQEWTV